jgi:ribonuclease BN (tRNA processing enzyme)
MPASLDAYADRVRVEVLGLRVGVPLEGACSCYLVSHETTRVLLDFGPGALERLWARGLIGAVDAIVVSHMHVDHVLDLLPLSGEVARAYAGHERTRLYVPRGRGLQVLDRLAGAIGSNPNRFHDAFEIREYDDAQAVEIGALRMTFSRTAHPELCYAARITDGSSTLVYGADGAYDDRLVRFAAGADVLLLEATYLDDGPALEHQGHMTGEQAAAVAREAGARGLVITHVGPWAGENDENLRRARAQFGGEVELAYEGAVFETARESGG